MIKTIEDGMYDIYDFTTYRYAQINGEEMSVCNDTKTFYCSARARLLSIPYNYDFTESNEIIKDNGINARLSFFW